MPPEPETAVSSRQLVLCLLLPALLLRLVQLLLVADDPLVRFPFGDGLSYSKWALDISEGDLLGAKRPIFYQAPLYPYVLSLLQTSGLGFWPWPQLLNAVAGTLTVLFVFLLARRACGTRPAWIAGAVMALWGPALVYECILDKIALGLCLTTACLWVLVRVHDRLQAEPEGPPGPSLLAGCLLGFGALLRENLLVLAPVAAVFFWIRTRRVQPAGALLAGALLGVLPAWLHNGAQGGAWLSPTSYQAGTNFWIGNHEGAEGTYEALVPGRGDALYEEQDARRLAAANLGQPADRVSGADVNRYWFDQAWAWASSDPSGWIGLQLRKVQWFVFHAEAPDSIPYDGFRRGRPWLLPSRLQFGLLLPCALLGFWILRRRSRARFLASLGLVAGGSVVLFYVVSRYRLMCVPFLLPFAARALLEARGRPLLLLVVAGLAIPSQLWLSSRPPTGLDGRAQEALLWINRGTALGKWTKDGAQAIAAFERALAIDETLLPAHRSLSRLLMKEGDFERALPHCMATVRFGPSDFEARHNLGFCLLELGRTADAEREFRLVLDAAGDQTPRITIQQLARCLDQQGKHAEAAALRGRLGARPGR